MQLLVSQILQAWLFTKLQIMEGVDSHFIEMADGPGNTTIGARLLPHAVCMCRNERKWKFPETVFTNQRHIHESNSLLS